MSNLKGYNHSYINIGRENKFSIYYADFESALLRVQYLLFNLMGDEKNKKQYRGNSSYSNYI